MNSMKRRSMMFQVSNRTLVVLFIAVVLVFYFWRPA